MGQYESTPGGRVNGTCDDLIREWRHSGQWPGLWPEQQGILALLFLPESYLAPLCLSFLISKTMIMLPMSQTCLED